METYATLRRRIASALLTAIGVVLVAAGLLTYTQPVAAVPPSSASPSSSAGPIGLQTLELPPTAAPSGSSAAVSRVATAVSSVGANWLR